ncbi:hypothetical protein ACFP51_00220 [Streptomyces pratens]|uniref:Uncharacterized protein n=1 Tax=Streptomyces pratens TaxID=887456 RepID=A0ABW1LS88_9ACTN
MHSHQVSIIGPPGAPPETAAIRFVALLPADWHAEVMECWESSARLLITAPVGTTTAQATRTAAEILSKPGLKDWHLADQ